MTDQQSSLQADVLALRNDVLRLDVNSGAAVAALRNALVEQAAGTTERLEALTRAVEASAAAQAEAEARFGATLALLEATNAAQAAEIAALKDERGKLREEIKALGAYISRSNEQHHAGLNDMVRRYKEFDEKFREFDTKANGVVSQLKTVAETLTLRMNDTQQVAMQYQKNVLDLLNRVLSPDTASTAAAETDAPVESADEVVPEDDGIPPVKPEVVEAVKASGLFDETWYRDRYGVRGPLETLIRHYLAVGFHDGFSPGPGFDGIEYYRRYRDVANLGINPLEHYVKFGKAEGRSAPPVAVHVIET